MFSSAPLTNSESDLFLGIAYNKFQLSCLLLYLKGTKVCIEKIDNRYEEVLISTNAAGDFESPTFMEGVNIYNIIKPNIIKPSIFNNDDYEFIGLAIGQRKLEVININDPEKKAIASLCIGLEAPFHPLIFAIYKRNLRNGNHQYIQALISFPWKEIVSLNNDGENDTIFNNTHPVEPPDLYVKKHRIQFMDDPTYDEFGFAFFPVAEIENLLLFCRNRAIISGILLEFGSGYHGYDAEKYFTLKMEADDLVNYSIIISAYAHVEPRIPDEIPESNISPKPMETVTGEPYFVIGTPCPPHWD